MPDYIYLLQNRLSNDQRNALTQVNEAARDAGMTVFLVGGAVRDLIVGSSVRDLDVAVQGNALKLKKSLLKAGATLWGEHEPSRTLFLRFPVGVTIEVSSTRREEYPKPGKVVYHWASILEDLRRRDFTANAMALSLNEHSYGLLMDPLNGVADIEARQLRLVSNYGFFEEPARLLRATRLIARLGWDLEERTKARFENAKEQGAIDSLSDYQRGYELEEIGHEEDGLRALRAMENEGWMSHLDPKWTSAKADAAGLEEMHRLLTQLQMQGISPDFSAVSMHFLTTGLNSKDLSALKRMFVRPGFVEEWDRLDSAAKDFAKQLTGKDAASPSATWKLFTSANPQAVLWLGLTSKAAPIQAKYRDFFTVWPEARQKIPYALMQELRITPEISGYEEMLRQLFFGTIDGKLETEEQLRAFLEPYSPPAPPPPVTIRKTRTSRKAGEAKLKLIEAEEGDEIDLERELEAEPDEGDAAPAIEQIPPAERKTAVAPKQEKTAPAIKSGAMKAEVAAKRGSASTAAKSFPKKQQKPVSQTAIAKAAKGSGSSRKLPASRSDKPSSAAKPKASASSRSEAKTAAKSHASSKERDSVKHAPPAKGQKKAAAKKPLAGKKAKSVKKR